MATQARTRVATRKLIGIDRRGFHGVDLFGHFHGAELGADTGSHAPANNQPGDDGAAFLDDRKNDDRRQHRFRAEMREAIARLQGEDYAGGRAGERHQGSDFDPIASI